MKKRVLCFIVAFAMLLVAFPAFADSYSYEAGSIYRAYSFSKTRPSGNRSLKVSCTKLTYNGLTSGKDYCYARPYSSDGASLLGTRTKITRGDGLTPVPTNSSWDSASNYKLKIYNAYYVDNSNQSYQMAVEGGISYPFKY